MHNEREKRIAQEVFQVSKKIEGGSSVYMWAEPQSPHLKEKREREES
jgi:hypothetical protein